MNMISLKRLTTILLTLIVINSTIAQDLLTLVPNDAIFVGMVNTGQIKTKADFEELIKLPLVQKMDKEIAKEFSMELIKADSSNYLDLRKYGISLDSKSYSYFVNDKEMFYGAILFSLCFINKIQRWQT